MLKLFTFDHFAVIAPFVGQFRTMGLKRLCRTTNCTIKSALMKQLWERVENDICFKTTTKITFPDGHNSVQLDITFDTVNTVFRIIEPATFMVTIVNGFGDRLGVVTLEVSQSQGVS